MERRFFLTLLVMVVILSCAPYPDAKLHRRSLSHAYTPLFNVKNPTNERSGINLEFPISVPSRGFPRRRIEAHTFDAIRDGGFRFVRIPVHFELETQDASLDEASFEYLDWIIENILSRDMVAILSYFSLISDTQFSFTSEAEEREVEKKFLTFWKMIAERYKEYPEDLYFELANEPHDPLTPQVWNEYVRKAITLIRDTGGGNANRIVVVPVPIRIHTYISLDLSTGRAWDQVSGIKELILPAPEEDPHLMISFHYYDPGAFTFQGEAYTPDLARTTQKQIGNTWDNTERQKQLIQRDFERITQWARAMRRPVILGEFGATGYADVESRRKWISFVREEAERRGMTWIFWGFSDGGSFGFLYNQRYRYWNRELLTALMPSTSEQVVSEKEVRSLISRLGASEGRERQEAVATLMRLGPAAGAAAPALIRKLEDEEWQVRKAAADALTTIRVASPGVIDALVERLHDEEWQVREAAARALGALGSAASSAVPTLMEALTDEEWQVCAAAVSALGRMEDEARSAVPLLLELLYHEEWLVRREAVQALARIAPDDPEVMNALNRMIRDPEPYVSTAALLASGKRERPYVLDERHPGKP